MALSKAEVREVFREAALRELAEIPPKEAIDHPFSEGFLARMAALIAEQKRGSWRLLSRQRRRVLVVAAILVLSMLLVACTPTLRNAVSDFVVSVYKRFVEYEADVELQPEIYTVYEMNSIPAGFAQTSSEFVTNKYFETVYRDADGTWLVFTQIAGNPPIYSADNENSTTDAVTIAGHQVVLYTASSTRIATWIQDNYQMSITYTGAPSEINIEEMIASVAPIDPIS